MDRMNGGYALLDLSMFNFGMNPGGIIRQFDITKNLFDEIINTIKKSYNSGKILFIKAFYEGLDNLVCLGISPCTLITDNISNAEIHLTGNFVITITYNDETELYTISAQY